MRRCVLLALVVTFGGCVSGTRRRDEAAREAEVYQLRAIVWLLSAVRARDLDHPAKESQFEEENPLGNDPWGRPYQYLHEMESGMRGSVYSYFLHLADTVRVRSRGEDGEWWTDDDIYSPPALADR